MSEERGIFKLNFHLLICGFGEKGVGDSRSVISFILTCSRRGNDPTDFWPSSQQVIALAHAYDAVKKIDFAKALSAE